MASLRPVDVKRIERAPVESEQPVALKGGHDYADTWELYEDFNGPSGSTLPAWLATQDTSAAGSPTLDYVDDDAGGSFQLVTDATDEAQNLSLYGGDNLSIDISKKPKIECRWKIDLAGATLTADQRLVIGLGSARNATLDSIALHAWIRVEGADNEILVEGDDGTTDTDDQSTGLDLVDDTYHKVLIDCESLADVRFWVDLEDGNGWQSAGGVDLSAATGNVQVFIEQQKDAGTDVEDLQIDYIKVVSER